MANQSRIGKTATTVATDSQGTTRVTYHSTVVVAFNDKQITLNNGGWLTATTVTRMNQTARQFNLGFSVSRAGGKMVASRWESMNVDMPFNGNALTFSRKGM